MGADGTKVLAPKVESDTKYLYYALTAMEVPAAGYSRHYKYLKKTQIPLPPPAEQKRIAGILDAADALRTKRREALAQLDTLIQSTLLDMFGDPVTNPMAWEVVSVGDEIGFLTSGSRGWAKYYAEDGDLRDPLILYMKNTLYILDLSFLASFWEILSSLCMNLMIEIARLWDQSTSLRLNSETTNELQCNRATR